MPDLLHPWLCALTLLDLAFAQATGIVSGLSLLPLFALALASFRLRRLQRHLTYRVLWNGGVLAVFALLVQHATTSGLLHMLEDGLVLAVLCQVHLINNIGERQRPDLVFFNSLLVAFVTSFFAADLTWCALFVTHALVLVPALEVNALVRAGQAPAWPVVRAALRTSPRRTAVVAAVTLLLFAILPRDFHRQGFLGEALLQQQLGQGLAERIRLDDERAPGRGDDVVLRVEAPAGLEVPDHWRGIAYVGFDGTSWLPQDAAMFGTRFATDPPYDASPDGGLVRPDARELGVVHAHLLSPDGDWLPLPFGAIAVRPQAAQGLLLDPKSSGAVALLRTEDAPRHGVDYTVGLGRTDVRFPVQQRVRDILLALPDVPVVRSARALAAQLRPLAAAADDPDRAAHLAATWLAEHRRYQLPGEHGFAQNLDAFLIGSGSGHCEYFATALALMLRCEGIPCRLVGGYLLAEHDADGVRFARARHAHAWVEALLPDGSWIELDATPPGAAADQSEDAGMWRRATDALTAWWSGIVGFDAQGQRRLLRWPLEHPFSLLAVLALATGVAYLCRRRPSRNPAVADLLAATQGAGLRLLPGETPRELLARARGAAVEERRLATLANAVARHEAARYRTAMEGPPDA